ILAQMNSDPGLPQTGCTISSWQVPHHADVGHIQSRALPETSDYVVIGSGIAGCGVTKALLHQAPSSTTVTVVEARGLCSGATGRNGGSLVKPYPSRFVQLSQDFGIDLAIKVARLANHTLEEVHKLADSYDEELRVEAAARRLTKITAFMDQESWDQARKDAEFYERHLPEEKGLYQYITGEELESKWNVKGACGGIVFASGVCWPYRLVTGVFKRLRQEYPSRLALETHTPVTTILHDETSNSKYPYMVVTPRGIIRAATVVHCTNGHTGHLLPRLRGKVYPMREAMSSQDAGSRMPDLHDKIAWSFLETPKYNPKTGVSRLGWVYGLQNKPAGQFWIGGEDRRPEELISADDSIISPQGRVDLETMLTQVFTEKWMPEKPKILGMWTGIVALTGDTLPFVGRLPSSLTARSGNGEWIAGGWNQYGMS
ncbi:DAO-domain-containing protein, partial [Sarocladium strictum]